jgi:hypothetical protein
MRKEEKEDDEYILAKYTVEFDGEPKLVHIDFHAPGCELKKP